MKKEQNLQNAETQALNIPDVNNSPLFGLSNRTIIGLGFLDKIRVLFGKKIRVNIDIDVDKEVTVVSTSAKTTVEPFLKPKPRKNDMQPRSFRDCC
jgi:hypothetical protein